MKTLISIGISERKRTSFSHLVKMQLFIPAVSAPIERLFSIAGKMLHAASQTQHFRSSLPSSVTIMYIVKQHNLVIAGYIKYNGDINVIVIVIYYN